MNLPLKLPFLFLTFVFSGCTSLILPDWDEPIFEGSIISIDDGQEYDISVGFETHSTLKGDFTGLFLAQRKSITWRYSRFLLIHTPTVSSYEEEINSLKTNVEAGYDTIYMRFCGEAETEFRDPDRHGLPGYAKGLITLIIQIVKDQPKIVKISFEPDSLEPHQAVKQQYEWTDIRLMDFVVGD